MIGYHYTSLDTVLKIIASKAVHLTNLRFCNDGNEFLYGLELLRTRDPETSRFENSFPDLENQMAPYWIACFSEHSDDHSQWMLYGDHGFGACIGVELSVLSGRSDYELESVVYDEAEQFRIIDEHIGAMASNRVPVRLSRDLARFKQSAFRSEAEHRLITFFPYPPPNEKPENIDFWIRRYWPNVKHRTKSGRLIPYLVITFPPSAIREVRLGPKANHPLNVAQLKIWLRSQKIDATVTASNLRL